MPSSFKKYNPMDRVWNYTKLVGEQIRKERIRQGLRQVDLDKKSGLCQALISSVETGKHRTLNIETIWLICQALHIRVSDLLLPVDIESEID